VAHPILESIATTGPGPVLLSLDWGWAVAAMPFLAAASAFALLRVALQHSNSARVLARDMPAPRRARLEPLLHRAERFATSAGILEVTCELAFAGLLIRTAAGDAAVTWVAMAEGLAFAVPAILLGTEVLPTAIAPRLGDALLVHALSAFAVLQAPLRWIVAALEALRRMVMRVVGLRQNPASARQIVEGLREVIEDAEISGDLDETEREIIGNVMEFRDVNVSAVMTPRTEVHGADIGDGMLAAARKLAESGHSRIPVYDGSLDTILGLVTARDMIQAAAERGLEQSSLQSVLRPTHFVPETKRLSELLSEFRREKIKLAIVLDEYGGTAGLVTLGDIVREIVGNVPDEFAKDAPQPVRRLPNGTAEVDAAVRVSEVNAELAIDIPEDEGYETLAGFVLSELGHFPKRGERCVVDGIEYTVIEASERRVRKVSIRRLAQRASA
jgi:CBS domain containing-hemolysin-like protein